MASIFKRNGIWYISYVDLTGRRIKRSLGVKDKRLAELKKKEIEIALAKGRLGFSIDIKLEDFVRKFLEWSKTTKAKGTYEVDKISCKDLIRYIGGNIRLSQITPAKLEGFKVWLVSERNLSKTSANIRLRHIKAMFSKAVEWQFLEQNPAEKLKQFKVPKGRPDFLTEEEIQKLFSIIENKTHLAIFNLLYLTGMRLSEATNLTWDDVDLEKGFIRIRSKAGWHTKNYKERFIPIHQKLFPHLYNLKEISKNNRVVPYNNRHIQRLLKKYSKKSGIKATPHILRHSFATAMASKGISLQAIKELLGHADYSTTLIYAKMTDDYKKKAIESIFNEEQ